MASRPLAVELFPILWETVAEVLFRKQPLHQRHLTERLLQLWTGKPGQRLSSSCNLMLPKVNLRPEHCFLQAWVISDSSVLTLNTRLA